MGMNMMEQPKCQLAFSADFAALHGRLPYRGDGREHSGHFAVTFVWSDRRLVT